MVNKKIIAAGIFCVMGCAAYVAWSVILNPINFYIIVPSYNNESWCLKNLESVLNQSYRHWHMIIINDCSNDKTSALLHDAVALQHVEHKVTIIDNKQRIGACKNIYDAVHGCNDSEVHVVPRCPDGAVVCILDGDDFYAHNGSLARVAQEYADRRVWMTYGNYACWPDAIASWCTPLPEHVAKNRLFRKCRWFTAHHRTYYAWLLKKIKKEDLMYGGEFLQATCDMALSFPALEMASKGHIRYIPDVIYIYNTGTPLNDYKIRYEFQEKMHRYIRGLPRYEPL